MKSSLPNTDSRALLQNAYLELKTIRAELDKLEQARTEPIAIIGMGCRFPGGANNPEAFWQLLREGRDAVTEIPADRWDVESYYDPDPETPGKIYTRYGGFLDQIDQFDPQFFGISPREAVSLDPQQRLLLEVSWEALENAGQAPDRLTESKTGVFIGISENGYAELQLISGDPTCITAYDGTGNGFCFVSGRLSYFFGLQGPNLTLDTGCSASLVALHLACQSLRQKECNLALAGGVHLIISPEFFVFLAKTRALSPDGRCKTFDAFADGFGRGEGCGMVALKRLSDAIADNDTILALIRGSAMNHDGPSSGLTVPNAMAQKELIRQALKNARVKPSQISYVEAHGTGTSLGDPIELRALGPVMGEGRTPDNPLMVGSVKTNIGHLQSAAGIASVIKVILSLQHQEIPPHLHFTQPSPHIPWDELLVEIPTQLTPWRTEGDKRIAGISSFGLGGTNVHVVMEEAPDSKLETRNSKLEKERPLHLLTLSAKSEEALRQLAERYVNHLNDNLDLPIKDICFTVNTGRSHFPQRLSALVASTDDAREKLSAFATQKGTAGILTGRISGIKPPKIAFLFTGQGSQYVDMGRQLYETQPTFRQILDRCNEILRPYLETSLLEILYPDLYQSEIRNPKSEIDITAYTQPALFALEYALAELWISWGVIPKAVIGHSIGEYAAACVAKVFSLEDGLKLVAERARLMQALPQDGKMVAVFANETMVSEILQPHAQDVSIAAINGPQSVVISGKRETVETIITNLQAEGIKMKPLTVSHAFHSPLMEPMLKDFDRVTREMTFFSPQIHLISNVSGQLAQDDLMTSEYWCRHIRQPVRFAAGIETLFKQGYDIFLEIGPKPVLLGLGRQIHSQFADHPEPVEGHNSHPASSIQFLPSLRQGRPDWQQILRSLAELYIHGVPVDWAGFDRDYPRRRIPLPTYPFQRQRCWLEKSRIEKSSAIASSENQGQKSILTLLQEKDTRYFEQKLELVEQLSEDDVKLLLDSYLKTRLANLSSEKIKLLELLLKQDRLAFKTSSDIVADYYNVISEARFQEEEITERFLTFAPFPEIIPGFSWILTLTYPQKYEEHYQFTIHGQKELREMLFRNVNFSSCQTVLDFGCGLGTDLITLARKYGHLTLHGYTISEKQAEIATSTVYKNKLQDRITIFNRDSAKDEFPAQYDLVLGFEVAHHIENKQTLFSNVGRHLTNNNFLVLADFISNAAFSIEHYETSSYFITKEEWVELLSQNGLQIVECIDVSSEIANFLYDPNFDENLKELSQFGQNDNVKAGLQSYDRLGKLLRKGLASYVLLTVQKQAGRSQDELKHLNREKLRRLITYSQVAARSYHLEWHLKGQGIPESNLEPDQSGSVGYWLIFADRDGIGLELAKLLEKQGNRCRLVFPSDTYEKLENGYWKINPKKPQDFERLLAELSGTEELSYCRVVHLWSLDAAHPEKLTIPLLKKAQILGCASTLHLIQALDKIGISESSRLWLVTRGTQVVNSASMFQEVAQTPLWGLGRVIALEQPSLQCTCIDLDPSKQEHEVEMLLAQLWLNNRENQLAFRQGGRYVARLSRYSYQQSEKQISIDENSSYLITGGLGALGLKVAQWLVEQGARYLILLGRRGVSDVAQPIINQIEQTGIRVKIVKADVSVHKEMVRVMEEIRISLPPLRGVIHAAGVLDDGILLKQSWERFEHVMAPKVEGTLNLHDVTQDLLLDFFVCFSSIASLIGSPGQGNYAAANAFMDAFVLYRRSQGLTGLSINWGPWAEGGMVATLNSRNQARITGSLGSIAPNQGLQMLGQLLSTEVAQIAITPINWSQFLQQFPRDQEPFLVSELAQQVRVHENGGQPAAKQPEFSRQLEKASPGERASLLINYFQKQIAKVLELSVSQLDVQQPLNNMGLDSLMAIELRNRIKTDLGVDVPMVKFMEDISISKLATLVDEQLTETLSILPAPTSPPIQSGQHAEKIDVSKTIRPEDAKQILTKLDKLDDKKVDELLKAMLSKKEES